MSHKNEICKRNDEDIQRGLSIAKVSARQQCVYEGS